MLIFVFLKLIYFVVLFMVFGNLVVVLFFIVGMIMFSGFIYVLMLNFEKFKFLGLVMLIGGVCFIVGWLVLVFGKRGSFFRFLRF